MTTPSTSMRQVGPYILNDALGRGGMGTVYRATHCETGNQVAIKTVNETRPGLLAVLRREIEALMSINHPGVVKIVDNGVDEGVPWYAMEIVEGLTLREHLRRLSPHKPSSKGSTQPTGQAFTSYESNPDGAGWWTHDATWVGELTALQQGGAATTANQVQLWPLNEGLDIMHHLCLVLAYLHGEGIVHRDLKPENIIVRANGLPVLVDFGLMTTFRADTGRESLDVPKLAAGTAAYISPEQASGELVDARADLYSMGCLLYELLTGSPPFPGPSTAALLHQHRTQRPMSPSKLSQKCHDVPQLEQLALQLLEKEPRQRVGHAVDVALKLLEAGANQNGTEDWPEPHTYLYRTTLRGRDEAVHRATQVLAEYENPKPVLIRGPSGIGRTRLLVEVGRYARRMGLGVAMCQCNPAQSHKPLEALRPILQRVADMGSYETDNELNELLGAQARLLALYEPSLADADNQLAERPALNSRETERHDLFATLERSISVMAQGKPSLLAIDDLQWADELTLGFVGYLLSNANCQDTPILLFVTWRSDEATAGLNALTKHQGLVAMDLKALEPNDVTNMMSDMLALESPPERLKSIVTKRADGNPFCVSEYLHAALDQGMLSRTRSGQWTFNEQRDDDAPELSLPASVRELVECRIRELSFDTRRLVACAAALGHSVNAMLLQSALQFDAATFSRAMHEALRRQFLEELGTGIVRFRQGHVAEMAYANTPDNLKQLLHRGISQALLRQYSPTEPTLQADLAHHLELAGDTSAAAMCYLRAARDSADRLAEKEAEKQYRKALSLFGDNAKDETMVRRELVDYLLAIRAKP